MGSEMCIRDRSQDEIFGTIQINRVEGAEAYVPGKGPELTE